MFFGERLSTCLNREEERLHTRDLGMPLFRFKRVANEVPEDFERQGFRRWIRKTRGSPDLSWIASSSATIEG